MIPIPVRGTAAAFVALVVTSACTSGGQGAVETAPRPASVASVDANAVARARADSIRHPYTDADVHFMTSMIGHHAQAVTMAHLAPERAESPAVKTLAARVINGQQDEIRTMQQWLRDRLKPVPQPDIPAAMPANDGGSAHDPSHGGMKHDSSSHGAMKHDSSSHGAMKHDSSHHAAHHPASDSTRGTSGHDGAGHSMPGMLSEAQMARLRAARGIEFDRLFLTYMIQHHRGAVTMVERLFGTYGAAQNETVFKFASDVNVDQITEIARMERMLRSLLFEAPAP